MERKERPAVRGLRPETTAERQHARLLHAMHSARAHLHACRAALDQAYASISEARSDAELLTTTQGAEHYALLLVKVESVWADLRQLHHQVHGDTLDMAREVSDLMEGIRILERAQGWA